MGDRLVRMIAIGSVGLAGVARATDFTFVEVGSERGVGAYTMALGFFGGVTAADYDRDGDVDLFVPTAEGSPNLLYRNLGDGTFEEIGARVGLDSTVWSRGGLFADFTGDGRLDLVVLTGCYLTIDACPQSFPRFFVQQPSGSFTDETPTSGLVGLVSMSTQHAGGLAAGDLDGDGDLDLLIARWFGGLRLFCNDGAGVFSDVTGPSGLSTLASPNWQPIVHDFDRDGALDIFCAIDFLGNELYRGLGGGRFEEVGAAANVDFSWNDMGVAAGDCDNDGDVDLYVTEITDAGRHNLLLRRDGPALTFTELAETLGVADVGWAWGVTLFDADNDGWIDIAATNGFTTKEWVNDASRFFRNVTDGALAYTDVSTAVGFDDTFRGGGLVSADLDRDGDLDLVQVTADGGLRVLDNVLTGEAANNHWLVIQPRMAGPNALAVGAVVRIKVGGMDLMRPITAGTSIISQEPAEAFFGLGGATVVDEIVVEWPDGRETRRANLLADQIVTITDAGPDLDGDGQVGFGDLIMLLADWGRCSGAGDCHADLDGDGQVGLSDVLVVLVAWG